MKLPDAVEVESGPNVFGSVIWLHGLGADGHDFEPVVPELGGGPDLRYVFPHAPMRPVTINGGMTMRAWYDILSLDRNSPQDETGIRESGDILTALIERERERGIPPERVVLAGFSQGGAIALHAALRFPEPLAGLMALSTYLPLVDTLDAEVFGNPHAQTRDIPVFMAHGSFDPVVPFDLGVRSRDRLVANDYAIEWHDYPMAHAVCIEEIADIRRWLHSVFPTAD